MNRLTSTAAGKERIDQTSQAQRIGDSTQELHLVNEPSINLLRNDPVAHNTSMPPRNDKVLARGTTRGAIDPTEAQSNVKEPNPNPLHPEPKAVILADGLARRHNVATEVRPGRRMAGKICPGCR